MATTRHRPRTSARTHKTRPRSYLAAASLLVAAALMVPLGTTSAGAAQGAPRHYQCAVTGSERSFPTLAARWWRWDLSAPAASNPLIVNPNRPFPCAQGHA
jgi:hypothetical protein